MTDDEKKLIERLIKSNEETRDEIRGFREEQRPEPSGPKVISESELEAIPHAERMAFFKNGGSVRPETREEREKREASETEAIRKTIAESNGKIISGKTFKAMSHDARMPFILNGGRVLGRVQD